MANDRDAVLPQGKTILIIEDEAALVAALSYNLRREGYGVASAMAQRACAWHEASDRRW